MISEVGIEVRLRELVERWVIVSCVDVNLLCDDERKHPIE